MKQFHRIGDVPANLDVPSTNTGDYVTSLGMGIPLPEKDLEINPELLQCDPDISEIGQPKTNGNTAQVNTASLLHQT